ncbi:GNAT family N-acetyltransferase [Marinicella sediminis]|uniref:GNAT family N-acetyltransferase n=2 Tax=Marinicella sediminis TaxID=1792834 RepID=A0ABV7J5Y4_9GAMM|nr:GNAT family N-acetyltransferase [Marinicella sediminis]
MNEPIIRLIEPEDNAAVKALVLETLAEFGLAGVGYAGVDAELDDMYQAYDHSLSAYYVVEVNGDIKGVGGFASLQGTDPGTTAELRKMYLAPDLRGLGVGEQLIRKCIKGAADCGYEGIYLETVPAMKAAQKLYQKHGFDYLDKRMGDTGHTGCGVTMWRSLGA